MTADNHPQSDTHPANGPETEASYEIRVKGHLDPSWSEWLGELVITPLADGVTVLTGLIIDQAALHGILDKLYAMNLTILSVVQVRDGGESENSQNG
jgi:hypothetical protein